MISNKSTMTPTYSNFIPGRGERLPGLASECYATMGTFKGDRVKEKRGCFDSQMARLRTHF